MSTPPAPADLVWLVMRAQEGDRQALERVLRHAYDLLRPFAASMIRDAAVREDVLQEVLVILYRKLRALREPRAFAGWARRIASREIFRALRGRRVHEQLHDELPLDLPACADPPEPADCVLDRLPELLQRVSPASRAVLALHYLDELTLDEIAAILELPPGTVKSRLAYGLATLRRALADSSAAA
jgi:RNA polymerase sigma-70 factor (ECF subfamily)